MISMPIANTAPTWPVGWPVPNSRQLHALSPSALDIELALDRIQASDVERDVAHRTFRVDGPGYAMRVVRGFRDPAGETSPQLNLPWG